MKKLPKNLNFDQNKYNSIHTKNKDKKVFIQHEKKRGKLILKHIILYAPFAEIVSF